MAEAQVGVYRVMELVVRRWARACVAMRTPDIVVSGIGVSGEEEHISGSRVGVVLCVTERFRDGEEREARAARAHVYGCEVSVWEGHGW